MIANNNDLVYKYILRFSGVEVQFNNSEGYGEGVYVRIDETTRVRISIKIEDYKLLKFLINE